MTARSAWEVIELERPSLLRVAVRGMGYEMEEIATVVATASGSLATFVDTVRPTSIAGRLLVALSPGIMQRDLDKRAGRLKSTLEADRVAGP